MGRARLLIVLIIVIVVVGVVAFVLLGNRPTPRPAAQTAGTPATERPDPNQTPIPTATPIVLVEIVTAVQDLPRGFRIPPNAVTLSLYPRDVVPFNAITDVEDVIGKIARTDIFREQPILSNLLVEDLRDIARVGSDAAAILPSNLVAVSIPIDRITSVAYAIQDGDRVDVILSMLFVDVDEIFQSIVPNNITLFTINEEEGTIDLQDAIVGRAETSAFGPVIVGPSEIQRPRLVTQRTIQEAFVVHVGNFPTNGRFIGVPPTPTPVPVATQAGSGQATRPPATPTPPRPDIITLGVSPQDAVVLVWAIEAQIPVTLALRSATDTSRTTTVPVSMDYIMNEFNITVPVKRPFALEPAIRSIRQLVAGERIQLRPGG